MAQPGGNLAVARLTAHAPDLAGAEALRAAFQDLSGKEAAPESVTLAQGMPQPGWLAGAVALFGAAKGLEDWEISISDMTATVSGIAPSTAEAGTIRAGLQTWAGTHGFTVKSDIANGPKVLDPDVIQAALEPYASCGPLDQLDPPPKGYVMGSRITITGNALEPDLDEAVKTALAGVIGDRDLVVDLEVLNETLCLFRGVLPPLPENAVSLWFGQGDTGEANLTGVFTTGQNPVVDVLIPATITEGKLWVVAVDNTGVVFNLLPNVNHEESEISKLGVVENGMRRIRVLYSLDEKRADKSLLAMQVLDTDYGKSEIIAFLSVDGLFDLRRPRDESIGALVEDLAAVEGGLEGKVIGFASRILESRP